MSHPQMLRAYRWRMLRALAVPLFVVATVVLVLRVLAMPRPLPVIMGAWFAATGFLMPPHPEAPFSRALSERLKIATFGGLVFGLVMYLVERL